MHLVDTERGYNLVNEEVKRHEDALILEETAKGKDGAINGSNAETREMQKRQLLAYAAGEYADRKTDLYEFESFLATDKAAVACARVRFEAALAIARLMRVE